MVLEYPYHIEIKTKEKAAYVVVNMCKNCENRFHCSGADAEKCNEIKKEIIEHMVNYH